jgi:hypothetical protein
MQSKLPMHLSSRCRAKTRSGNPCRSPAMPNGRCRMHGGPSPGAAKGNKNAHKHGSDSLKIGATNGFVFSGWSPLTSLTVNAPVDNPPVVSAVGTSVPATKGEVFQASDLFSASDADHDSLAYLF